MKTSLKIAASIVVASLAWFGFWFVRSSAPPDPVFVSLPGSVPALIPLSLASRAHFAPTIRKGYHNNEVMVQSVKDGYSFSTTISPKGDAIYLGRAMMKRGVESQRD